MIIYQLTVAQRPTSIKVTAKLLDWKEKATQQNVAPVVHTFQQLGDGLPFYFIPTVIVANGRMAMTLVSH